jgi:hypothetical protein
MRDIARCTLEILDLARRSYSAATLFGRLLMGGIFLWSGADKLLAPAATIPVRRASEIRGRDRARAETGLTARRPGRPCRRRPCALAVGRWKRA